jgi:hypothetical protein
MGKDVIEFDKKIMLRKIISGGQTGADQAGLFTAKTFNLETGGYAPAGFRTLAGNNVLLRDMFGLEETQQWNYAYRTELNVKSSDATVRFASNFNSPGEKCTLKAIIKSKKPYFDVDLRKTYSSHFLDETTEELIKFLCDNDVLVLNVAGNADRNDNGFGFHFHETTKVLIQLITKIKEINEAVS